MSNENWDLLAPYFLDCNYTLPREKHVEVAKFIRNHYFGWKKIDDTTIQSLIQVANDRFFVVDSEKSAKCRLNLINNLFDITIISTEAHTVSVIPWVELLTIMVYYLDLI